jgi:hypothetical protein
MAQMDADVMVGTRTRNSDLLTAKSREGARMGTKSKMEVKPQVREAARRLDVI